MTTETRVREEKKSKIFSSPEVTQEGRCVATIDIPEVLGTTPTEKFIHFVLTTLGPKSGVSGLTSNQLLSIVGGSPEYLLRVLRSMSRQGVVRQVSLVPDGLTGGTMSEIWDALGHQFPETGWRALNREERIEWLIPAYIWERDEPTGFFGRSKTSGGTQAAVDITDAAALQKQIDRLWGKSWFKLGDERKLRLLFPEFSEVSE